jgi:ribose/xylose/arabinose/galactoside ABC-type transport system permease subunit
MCTMKIRSSGIVNALNTYAIFLVLLVMAVIMTLTSTDFLTPQNLINLFSSESSRGLLAVGVGLVIIAGGIDLSIGATMALTSVTTASLVQQATYASRLWPNLPFIPVYVAVLAGLACGVIVGIINGLIIAYTKTPPFIATLGTMLIVKGAALMYTNAFPVPMLRDGFKRIGQGKWFSIPYIVIIFILIAVIAWVLLNYTRWGKNLYAIGGNENAARVAGVRVEKNVIAVYIWSGVLAAISGLLLTARSGSGIATLGQNYEFDAIAAAIVGGLSFSGGIGRISGIFAGIFILGILNNGLLLLNVSPYLQQVIKGIIIVAAVVIDMRKHARRG